MCIRDRSNISLPLLYSTGDNETSLSGLTLNVHYDSSSLTPYGSNHGVSDQISAAIKSVALVDDSSNLDNDSTTDKILRLAWGTFDSSFPGIDLPAAAATLTFTTSNTSQDPITGNDYSTSVNFTAGETAAGYNFENTGLVLNSEVNQTPSAIGLSDTSFNENIAGGSTVATISTTDPDSSDTHTYSLVTGTGSGDNASFTIDGSSLKINSSPDYETKSSYNIRLKTTDAAGESFEDSFSLSVKDLNEISSIEGDETIQTTSENDVIDGLGGTDTLTITGNFSDYTFTRGTDTLEIADQRTTGTTDGTDTLKNLSLIHI
mgnify:CR=1 FL=1